MAHRRSKWKAVIIWPPRSTCDRVACKALADHLTRLDQSHAHIAPDHEGNQTYKMNFN